ncbi:HemK/PrmC family methyltransferase [Gryllotalpicola kribbensis]|uniref:N5-glutamine methyltransferase family protein n=1 Tax=Gryllotalpicola kribbensis TaxID=993084 RepID=UPI0031DD9B93
MFAEDEARLLLDEARDAAQLERLVARRVAGEPLEYVLGWVEFAGLRLAVAPGVFVPRRRTELLLELAQEAVSIRAARESTSGDTARESTSGGAARESAGGPPGGSTRRSRMETAPSLLEVCCGVAPVATAVKRRMPEASVVASDLDPAAVAVARTNLETLGGTVVEGDLFAALSGGRFDVIVANAPYVPSSEVVNMPREAREFEHPLALDGGDDGLALHRRIADEAAAWLAPGGTVLVETSRRQAPRDREIFEAHGWRVELVRDDELDATAVRATRP